MKKNLLILPILLVSLSGCQNSDFIYYINNFDSNNEAGINIDSLGVNDLLKSGASFVLYTYSDSCVHCQSVSENFSRYAKNTNLTYYKFSPIDTYYQVLVDNYPSYFPSIRSTPKVQLFKDGELLVQINNSRLTDYNLFSSSLNNYTKPSSVYTLSNQDDFVRFLNQNNDFFLLFFNSDDLNNLTNFYSNIFNNINDVEINSLVIDLNKIDLEFEKMFTDFLSNSNLLSNAFFIQQVQDGIKKEEVTFTNDDTSSLLDFIDSIIETRL